MKKSLAVIPFLLLATIAFAQTGKTKKNNKKSPEVKIETYEQRLSYGVGFDLATNLKQQGIELDADLMMLGFKHAFSGDTAAALMTLDQIKTTFQEFQQKQQEAMTKKMMEQKKANLEKGKAYLDAQMKANPNIKLTPSGIGYEVITEGTGPKPTAANTVKVYYEGATPDGLVFDKTEIGKPATFPLNGVIPGWTEGLQLMSVGSKYRFIIPAQLAYGGNPPQGTPIEAGMTLIFVVELLDIEK